ncbi:MAG: hypothetical protein U5N26_08670 [Candidatus Marinimicrobia bacterium]|nr:hypothetical protein [Candidatus Neomarinimicrobiota bacterium]
MGSPSPCFRPRISPQTANAACTRTAGAVTGGIVQPVGQGVEKNVRIIGALNRYAEKAGFGRIVMTLPPDIYNRQLNNYLEFACFISRYRYLKREISSVLKLEDSPEKNIAKFKSTNRTAFRRGEKRSEGP